MGYKWRWTDEMDEVVRKAYRDRERLADVAVRLGVTRNAVSGRAWKLGLTRPISEVAQEMAEVPWRRAQVKEVGRRRREKL